MWDKQTHARSHNIAITRLFNPTPLSLAEEAVEWRKGKGRNRKDGVNLSFQLVN